MLKSRRRAREAALQALYGCEVLGCLDDVTIAEFFALHHPADGIEEGEHEHRAFAELLIQGVRTELTFIDRALTSSSTNWSVTRMSRVDRNILRVAAYEIAFVPDIPVSVSINEAIEIAKEYGCDESPTFVNGLLDQLARKLKEDVTVGATVRAKESKRAVNE